MAAAGVDPKILDTLNAAFNKALNSPAVKQQLATQAYEIHTGPRQDLFDLAKKERPVWADVIKQLGRQDRLSVRTWPSSTCCCAAAR